MKNKKTIKLLIEFEYDEDIMYGDSKEAKEWFFNEVLNDKNLSLHSNEIGDDIGNVKILKIKK